MSIRVAKYIMKYMHRYRPSWISDQLLSGQAGSFLSSLLNRTTQVCASGVSQTCTSSFAKSTEHGLVFGRTRSQSTTRKIHSQNQRNTDLYLVELDHNPQRGKFRKEESMQLDNVRYGWPYKVWIYSHNLMQRKALDSFIHSPFNSPHACLTAYANIQSLDPAKNQAERVQCQRYHASMDHLSIVVYATRTTAA
jgi:hypothetical protein